MSRSDLELLREARVHLERAQRYGGEAEQNQLVVDAVCMRLSAAIEVLAVSTPYSEPSSSARTGLRCGACATASPMATSW